MTGRGIALRERQKLAELQKKESQQEGSSLSP